MADLNELNSAGSTKVVGSDSSGSETNFLTVDSNGFLTANIRPYEPQTFSLVVNTIALANNKSMIALLNPSGSTKVLKIIGIKIINNRTSTTTGVAVDFRGRRITGLTSGTSVTPESYDTNNSLGSGIISATGGTVSGESSSDLFRRVWSSDEWGPGTTDVESFDHAMQQSMYSWNALNYSQPITLRESQGITIKCVTNTTAGDFDFEIVFTQE